MHTGRPRYGKDDAPDRESWPSYTSQQASDTLVVAMGRMDECPARARLLSAFMHAPAAASLPRPFSPSLLLALLVGAAFFALHYPTLASFPDFILADAGASLKLDVLLASELRPGVDFGYTYGPLSAVVSRIGYGLVGRTAPAHLALVALLSLGSILGLARCMARLETNWTGLAMALLCTQFFVRNFGFNLTYGLESACLLNALACHMEGRRDRALALAVLAALVKPSMGILYSALLVFWILRRVPGLREAWRQLRPAVVTATLALTACVAILGFQSTLRTAIPLVGAVHYSARGARFTRLITTLVAPSGVNFKYYLGTLAGFWILGTALLVLGAARALSGVRGNQPRAEVGVTCAVLHLAFTTLFFGPWQTYLGLLVVGVFCVVERGAFRWALVAIALVGSTEMVRAGIRGWKERTPDAHLLGTWVRPAERQEVNEVLRVVGSQPMYFLTTGFPEGLFPGSHGSRSWFVAPGVFSPAEQEAMSRDMRTSPVVVVSDLYQGAGILQWDWVRQSLTHHTRVHSGELFTVFVTGAPPVRP
ncbi:hypothetical protein OV207_16205 [Corallococcus sp. BB11-1]|uniref:hypothetical protein n=1 Tax=Corallococcus sp. BB11-1 TaxID=2996783 RepID=UPI0010ED7E45|nr:hypothetical protein [Corallococcus sp. BB11-1]MCY1033015.1 hypothetical protein [Corallococcus sp. BB11-1]RYZ45318.1 MAG: hypothetical protein EOO72_04390 [Myxococcaceae bacterium]